MISYSLIGRILRFANFLHSFILETYIAPPQDTTTQRRSQPSHDQRLEGDVKFGRGGHTDLVVLNILLFRHSSSILNYALQARASASTHFFHLLLLHEGLSSSHDNSRYYNYAVSLTALLQLLKYSFLIDLQIC